MVERATWNTLLYRRVNWKSERGVYQSAPATTVLCNKPPQTAITLLEICGRLGSFMHLGVGRFRKGSSVLLLGPAQAYSQATVEVQESEQKHCKNTASLRAHLLSPVGQCQGPGSTLSGSGGLDK